MIIDVHAHCIPSAFLSWLERNGGEHHITLIDSSRGRCVELAGVYRTAPLRPDLSDLDRRIAEMDRMGVDVQVLAGWIDLTAYQLPSSAGVSYSRAHNDLLAEEAATHPSRFKALATVPLQDPPAAAAELERAMDELDMVGAQIATTVGERWLDQCALDPFWEAAEAKGSLILLHPMAPLTGLDLNRFFLDNSVGRPAESTIALAGLIFSGVLERFPNLRLCVVHGGGFAPFQIGRMDRAYSAKPELAARHLSYPPSHYLRRIYVDTVIHEPAVLAFLVGFLGADHVLLGTDYPFEMGESDPLRLIDQGLEGFDSSQKQAILGLNALRLIAPEGR